MNETDSATGVEGLATWQDLLNKVGDMTTLPSIAYKVVIAGLLLLLVCGVHELYRGRRRRKRY